MLAGRSAGSPKYPWSKLAPLPAFKLCSRRTFYGAALTLAVVGKMLSLLVGYFLCVWACGHYCECVSVSHKLTADDSLVLHGQAQFRYTLHYLPSCVVEHCSGSCTAGWT